MALSVNVAVVVLLGIVALVGADLGNAYGFVGAWLLAVAYAGAQVFYPARDDLSDRYEQRYR